MDEKNVNTIENENEPDIMQNVDDVIVAALSNKYKNNPKKIWRLARRMALHHDDSVLAPYSPHYTNENKMLNDYYNVIKNRIDTYDSNGRRIRNNNLTMSDLKFLGYDNPYEYLKDSPDWGKARGMLSYDIAKHYKRSKEDHDKYVQKFSEAWHSIPEEPDVIKGIRNDAKRVKTSIKEGVSDLWNGVVNNTEDFFEDLGNQAYIKFGQPIENGLENAKVAAYNIFHGHGDDGGGFLNRLGNELSNIPALPADYSLWMYPYWAAEHLGRRLFLDTSKPTNQQPQIRQGYKTWTQDFRESALTQESLNADKGLAEMASEISPYANLKFKTDKLYNRIKELEAQLRNDKGELPTDEEGNIIGDENLVNEYSRTYWTLYDMGAINPKNNPNPHYAEFENNMARFDQLWPEYERKLHLAMSPELKPWYEFAGYFPIYNTGQQAALDLNNRIVPREYFATQELYNNYLHHKNTLLGDRTKLALMEDMVSLMPYGGQAFKFAGKPMLGAATKIATNELAGNTLAYGINEGIYSADNWFRNNVDGYDEKVSPYVSAGAALTTNVFAPWAISKTWNGIGNRYYNHLNNKHGGPGNVHLKPNWFGELKIDKVEFPDGHTNTPLFFRPQNQNTMSIDLSDGTRQYFGPDGPIPTPANSPYFYKDLGKGVTLQYPRTVK